jgi:hypothetical protein
MTIFSKDHIKVYKHGQCLRQENIQYKQVVLEVVTTEEDQGHQEMDMLNKQTLTSLKEKPFTLFVDREVTTMVRMVEVEVVLSCTTIDLLAH